MSINFNKARAELWGRELFRLFDLYEEFLSKFDLNLYGCSMEKITFCNDKFFFHITYAYDRYQMECNNEMPLTMIYFGNGIVEKSIIDIFKEKLNTIDIYNELQVLNQETNDQGITYKILLENYITPLIVTNQLF